VIGDMAAGHARSPPREEAVCDSRPAAIISDDAPKEARLHREARQLRARPSAAAPHDDSHLYCRASRIVIVASHLEALRRGARSLAINAAKGPLLRAFMGADPDGCQEPHLRHASTRRLLSPLTDMHEASPSLMEVQSRGMARGHSMTGRRVIGGR
jgi:hypothetical protein